MTQKTPQRIQLKRAKGFRLQEVSKALNGLEAVKVARPGKWGNPYRIGGIKNLTRAQAVESFKLYIQAKVKAEPDYLEPLQGKNLACFCNPADECHADILLEMIKPAPSSK